MTALKIIVRDAVTGPVLEVSGELDWVTAGELRQRAAALTLAGGQRLVVDLAGLDFSDSSGLTALLAARHHALAAGAQFALAAVPPNTLRILRVCGLDQVFPLHPDADSATRP
jgi:anti-sigma B factor antagonist